MANQINVKLPPPATNCKTIKQVGQCNRWNLSDSGLFRKFAAASPSLHGLHGAQWKWKFHENHPSRNVGLLEIGSQNRNMHSAGLCRSSLRWTLWDPITGSITGSGPGSWEGWQLVGVFHAGDRIDINLSCSCLEALKSNRFWAGLRNDPRHHGNLSLSMSAWLKSAPRSIFWQYIDFEPIP